MRVLALSGSLRKDSSNGALLRAAASLAPASVEFVFYEGLGELPHFNPDLDRGEPPAVVKDFRRALASVDALLISSPEYAHGIPGVLKNGLDWLVSDTSFPGKSVAILSGSASDASFARGALIEVLKTMSARVITDAVVGVAGARVKFDAQGKLTDERASSEIKRAIEALVAAVGSPVGDGEERAVRRSQGMVVSQEGGITRTFSGAPWEKRVGYCRAIRVGETIAVTGTIALGENGAVHAPGDAYAQARRCIEIIERAIRPLGAELRHVIRTRMFVTDISRWQDYGRAHGEFFGVHPPATTMVEVKALIDPAAMIEIEVDAVVLGSGNKTS